MTALGLRSFTCRTLDILKEWMGLIILVTSVVVEQQTTKSGADWRRRRSRGGMVAVVLLVRLLVGARALDFGLYF
jgi:hypothetical protein